MARDGNENKDACAAQEDRITIGIGTADDATPIEPPPPPMFSTNTGPSSPFISQLGQCVRSIYSFYFFYRAVCAAAVTGYDLTRNPVTATKVR